MVLNSGSSSIKYQLFHMPAQQPLLWGVVERIGEAEGTLTQQGEGRAPLRRVAPLADHAQALAWMVAALEEAGVALSRLEGIGHRVVHGGERFCTPVRIDPEVVAAIRAMVPLAPLHNPANILGIEVMTELAPTTPQVAVFDTAFHQTLPAVAFRYALPAHYWREQGVRRYGFHGISHQSVCQQAAQVLARPLQECRLISLHLGNGASVAAVCEGRSIDTSMGMTPLEGLVMGSRCGDLDPGVVLFLQRERGLEASHLERLLNRESGLLGLCGSSDMREVLARAEQGEAAAQLAVELFCYRIRKYIGAYLAILGGLDGLIFTGGIGEQSAAIRARCCSGLEHLNIRLDPSRNEAAATQIQREGAGVAVLVLAAAEERAIAEQVANHLEPRHG